MRKIILLGIVFALIFSLTSCGNLVHTEEGDEIKAQCEEFIDCVISGDGEKAFTVITKGANKESFLESFSGIKACISGVETYTLEQAGWYEGYNNGQRYYQATFIMATNTVDYVVTAMTVNGSEGIYRFNIVEKSKSNAVYTGTLTTLKGATLSQWGMIVFSAICLVFVILMLIDCAKRKIKNKALWIILILLYGVGFVVKGGSGFGFKFNILSVGYSYLQVFGNGDFVFNLVLPLGAIIYMLLRKKLKVKEEALKCEISDSTLEVENVSCEKQATTDEIEASKENTSDNIDAE